MQCVCEADVHLVWYSIACHLRCNLPAIGTGSLPHCTAKRLLRRTVLIITHHDLFGFRTFQRKQEIVYHLRRFIREGVDVDEGLDSIKNELGEDLESLLDEARQSTCPEDGQNLLMYAATHGREVWLLRLVDDIMSRVRV